MRSSRLVQMLTVGLLSAVLGYGFGRTHEDVAKKGGDPGETERPLRNRSRDASRPEEIIISPELGRLLGDQPLTKTSIHEVTTRVLTESDPARRLAGLGLIIDSMTPATALLIRQAYLDNTINTGRRDEGTWDLMIRKFGATLGAAALEELKNNPGQTAVAIGGWAMADPDAALAHFRKMDPSDPAYRQSCSAMLTGIASVDPGRSIQMVLAEPTLTVNSKAMVTAAVQSLGMAGVTQTLQNVLDRSSPETAQSLAFQSIFDEIADTMMHQTWTSGRSENVLPWLEQLKGQPFLSDQIADHAILNVALQGKMSEALDWLDRMNDPKSESSIGRSGIRSALMKDPSLVSNLDEDTFGRVMKTFPPNSPEMKFLADVIAPLKPAYASRLRAGGP